jgi:hypothetical protein
MNDQTQKSHSLIPKSYHYFVMAVAIGIIIGTVVPLLLEYFGIIDYVKNWP